MRITFGVKHRMTKVLENERLARQVTFAREFEEAKWRLKPFADALGVNYEDLMLMLAGKSYKTPISLLDYMDIYRGILLQDPELVREEVDKFINDGNIALNEQEL